METVIRRAFISSLAKSNIIAGKVAGEEAERSPQLLDKEADLLNDGDIIADL